ncbi:universal stress protein [Amnibacterium sp.]|uniref:universal stress protein n=1 Tax=Amnibacterium sp. TaxID=1872496 RepID=UPI003F7B63A3
MPEVERAVVVGIADDQADAVLLVAAAIAAQFEAKLICVTVDPERYAARDDQGNLNYWPIDPDAIDDPAEREAADAELRAHLAELLDPLGVGWSIRLTAGDPSAGLAHVAAEVSALMIVIGTSPRTLIRSAREFFSGSIAAHLTHRQPRPVLVVPLNPVLDGTLPWSGPE